MSQSSCSFHEIEVGVIFSHDGANSWVMAMTAPKYVSDLPEECDMRLMVAPKDDTSLCNWVEYVANDNKLVHLPLE